MRDYYCENCGEVYPFPDGMGVIDFMRSLCCDAALVEEPPQQVSDDFEDDELFDDEQEYDIVAQEEPELLYAMPVEEVDFQDLSEEVVPQAAQSSDQFWAMVFMLVLLGLVVTGFFYLIFKR